MLLPRDLDRVRIERLPTAFGRAHGDDHERINDSPLLRQFEAAPGHRDVGSGHERTQNVGVCGRMHLGFCFGQFASQAITGAPYSAQREQAFLESGREVVEALTDRLGPRPVHAKVWGGRFAEKVDSIGP